MASLQRSLCLLQHRVHMLSFWSRHTSAGQLEGHEARPQPWSCERVTGRVGDILSGSCVVYKLLRSSAPLGLVCESLSHRGTVAQASRNRHWQRELRGEVTANFRSEAQSVHSAASHRLCIVADVTQRRQCLLPALARLQYSTLPDPHSINNWLSTHGSPGALPANLMRTDEKPATIVSL